MAAVFATLAPLPRTHAQAIIPSPVIIAYVFPNLPGDRLLAAADVDPTRITRINYAFALIKNGRVVEGSPNDAANLVLLTSLKATHPGLEVVVSVGGWLGSGGFSDAALTPGSRATFIDSVMTFLTRYNLDGLDIDWEYPGQSGAGNPNRPEDGANFTALLRELRTRFDAQTTTSKHLLLTIAAGSSTQYIADTQLGEASRYLDQVNLMAYDFYEPGDKPAPTGNHAPLFADPADPHHASSADIVHAFEQAGVPASKLVLGVPFYGHAWGNVPPTNHGLFQTGIAVPNLHTSYPEILNLLQHGFARYWDSASQVPYAYSASARQFITYEDPESLRRKCSYIHDQHLAGIMFWQYFSDPSGTLLTTINTSLGSTPSRP